jgi:hypothetical protein
MFIHDFIQLDVPASVARSRLLEDGSSWVTPLAEGAYREGEALRVRVGPLAARRPASKRVVLHFEKPYDRGELLVLPLHWIASGASGLFPQMEADLEIGPVGDDRSQLSFRGRYRPPLGPAGRVADSLLLHRVAESSVRTFLRRVGEALEHVPETRAVAT